MPWNMPTTNPSCCIGFPPQQGRRQHYSEYSWTRDSDDYSDVGLGGIGCRTHNPSSTL